MVGRRNILCFETLISKLNFAIPEDAERLVAKRIN